MPRQFSLLELSTGITVTNTVRYLLFAGIAWLVAYVWFRRRWLHRKINQQLPAAADIRRELKDSVITLVIFGFVGMATFWAATRGWTQMYWRIGDHGRVWFWASVALTIVLHDTYFYWTHRLMHHRRFFRLFHRRHHLSMNPTPWASFAFSPLEALVQASIFPLAVLLMPIHPLSFAIFMVWQMTFNVLGHTGYEFHPGWLMDSPLRHVLNTPTNHAQHHEKFRGNFGLYFNVWDRLMGTNHEDYEQRFREVTSRLPANGEAADSRPQTGYPLQPATAAESQGS
jgi:sterol desaturase/sphingolipid hydroxylase (fatty acid hydroxylase superfamily)